MNRLRSSQSRQSILSTEFEEHVVDQFKALLAGQQRIEQYLYRSDPLDKASTLRGSSFAECSRFEDVPILETSTSGLMAATSIESFESVKVKQPPSPALGWLGVDSRTSSLSAKQVKKPLTKSFFISESGTNNRWSTAMNDGWVQTIALRFEQRETDRDSEIMGAIEAVGQTKRLGKSTSTLTSTSSKEARVWMLAPTSWQRLLFDVCSVLILGYDLVTVPFFLAWDVDIEGALFRIQCLIPAFWTADILFTFRTGFVDGGDVIMSPARVAKRYLTSWFLPELMLILVDWTSIVVTAIAMGASPSNGQRVSGVFRLGKVARIIRLLGVLRLVKLSDAIARLSDRNLSVFMVLALQCAQLLGLIIYVNHILGCVWYVIARDTARDTGSSWLDSKLAGQEALSYDEAATSFQYLTCLHWSLTQMTPGSMQINAQNTHERLFNICCLIIGLICFSTMISALSANLTQLRMLNQQKSAHLSQLVRFLRERHISPSLAYMVKQQAVDRLSTQTPLLQSDVRVLSNISVRFQAKLHASICQPVLETHPIFLMLMLADERVSDEIIFEATSLQIMAKEDTLFASGRSANCAYVVMQGCLQYKQVSDLGLLEEDLHTRGIERDTWLSEHALWSKWTHVGTADCGAVCEILIIDPVKLYGALRSPVFSAYIEHFGVEYHKRLTAKDRDQEKYPSDLPDAIIDNIEVMTSLPKLLLIHMGLITVEWLRETTGLWHLLSKNNRNIDFNKLVEEVKHGRTVLVPRPQGEVLRVARVSCVEILRDDGFVLVQIGKFNNDGLQPQCMLPGTTVNGWEDQRLAFQRFLFEDLQIRESDMTVLSVRDECEFRDSHKYGLRTKFYRTVHEAAIRDLLMQTTTSAKSSNKKLHSQVSQATARSLGSRLRLSADEVFTIAGTEGKIVYTWIPYEHLDHLTNSAGVHDLRKNMSLLALKQGHVKAIALAQHDDVNVNEGNGEHSENCWI